MKSTPFGIAALFSLILWAAGCATPQSQFFESPPGRIPASDQELFSRAVTHQKKGQIEPAIALWEKFLQKYPDSFEAHNNLGLLFYANDQISQAVGEFEKGMSLEPGSAKIKENLLRALKVRVAILEENKELDDGIRDLRHILELSPQEEREKVGRQIEEMEDKIFEQVKKSDTLEEYRKFLEKYPDNPQNSDAARQRVAELTKAGNPPSSVPEADRETGFAGISGEDIVSETFAPETVPPMDGSPPMKSIDRMEPSSKPPEEIPFTGTPASGAEPPPASVMPPQPENSVAPPASPAVESPAPPVVKSPAPTAQAIPAPGEPKPASPPKLVQIMTKKTPLNVRAKPQENASVLSKLPKGAKVPLVREKGGWYKVEYTTGKSGWISKKYSKLLE